MVVSLGVDARLDGKNFLRDDVASLVLLLWNFLNTLHVTNS